MTLNRYKWFEQEFKDNPNSIYLDSLYKMQVYIDWKNKKINDKEFIDRYFGGT